MGANRVDRVMKERLVVRLDFGMLISEVIYHNLETQLTRTESLKERGLTVAVLNAVPKLRTKEFKLICQVP